MTWDPGLHKCRPISLSLLENSNIIVLFLKMIILYIRYIFLSILDLVGFLLNFISFSRFILLHDISVLFIVIYRFKKINFLTRYVHITFQC